MKYKIVQLRDPKGNVVFEDEVCVDVLAHVLIATYRLPGQLPKTYIRKTTGYSAGKIIFNEAVGEERAYLWEIN